MNDLRKLPALSLAWALGAGLAGCSGDTTLGVVPADGGAGATTGATRASTASTGALDGAGSTGGRPGAGGAASTNGSSGSTATGTGGGSSGGTTGAAFRPPPWPNAPVTVYGAAQGIQELPVVSAQPDEANNLWVVTNAALYLMSPGSSRFVRYTDADGLHVGLSYPPGITTVGGGGPNQCFVGYEGDDDGTIAYEPQADWGKFDRVDLQPDGGLDVLRFDVHDTVGAYWENRSTRRFLYDHWFHPGNLYVGMQHGVDRVFGDTYADHIHPIVCLGGPCTGNTSTETEMMGEWRGLAFDAQGNLWMAGEFTAGEIGWTANLDDWIDNSDNPFIMAFGDPYPPWAPVFEPPVEGDPVNLQAVAVDPSGTVWFLSSFEWNPPNSQGVTSDAEYGVASYTPKAGFTYYDPISLGFGTMNMVDMVALPDGRLVFGTWDQGLIFWSPATNAVTTMTTAQGLAGNDIQQMYLDTRNGPPTLFVGTDQGLAIVQP